MKHKTYLTAKGNRQKEIYKLNEKNKQIARLFPWQKPTNVNGWLPDSSDCSGLQKNYYNDY